MIQTKIILLSIAAAFALSACGNTGDSSVKGGDVNKEGTVASDATEVSPKPGAADDIAAKPGEPVTINPNATEGTTAKPGGPVTISYRIIGTPIVGQALAIDLQFASALGPQPITVSYRVNDATAMHFPEAQPATISMVPSARKELSTQQVTVIPMREGRLYLNVSAQIETEDGSMSSVTAVPIQVGSAARELQANGELRTDENGETVISLPAKED